MDIERTGALPIFSEQRQGRGAGGGRLSSASMLQPLPPLVAPPQNQGDKLQEACACWRHVRSVPASRLLHPKRPPRPLEGLEVPGLLGPQRRALVGEGGRAHCLTRSLLFQLCLLLPPTATVKCAFLRLFQKQRERE